MENGTPKANRKWPRLILHGILIVLALVVAFYVAAISVFAIWHLILILLGLFGLVPGGH